MSTISVEKIQLAKEKLFLEISERPDKKKRFTIGTTFLWTVATTACNYTLSMHYYSTLHPRTLTKLSKY